MASASKKLQKLRDLPLSHKEAVLVHHALYMAYGNTGTDGLEVDVVVLWDRLAAQAS